MLEWDDLRMFLAIARHGSLTAAARALHVTQPTMGRRLEVLEERLGVRLFERLPSGAALTDFGSAILENAERMETEAAAAERRIAARDARLEGTIRVTTIEWFGQHALAPAIAVFTERHPKVTVELVTDERFFSLTKHEADIAVRFVRFEQQGLVQRKVGTVGFGLDASVDYLEHYGTPDFSNLGEGHAIVALPEDAGHLPEMRWLMEEIAPRARIALRSNSRDSLARAAEAGAGLAVLARCLGELSPIASTPAPASSATGPRDLARGARGYAPNAEGPRARGRAR